jgi:hypothetical protein
MPLIIQLRKTISCGEVHQAEVSRVSTRRWEVQGVGYGGMQKFNVGNVCDGFPKSTRHLPSNSESQRSLCQCSDGIYTVEARISVGGITGLANYVIVSTRRGWLLLAYM